MFVSGYPQTGVPTCPAYEPPVLRELKSPSLSNAPETREGLGFWVLGKDLGFRVLGFGVLQKLSSKPNHLDFGKEGAWEINSLTPGAKTAEAHRS